MAPKGFEARRGWSEIAGGGRKVDRQAGGQAGRQAVGRSASRGTGHVEGEGEGGEEE